MGSSRNGPLSGSWARLKTFITPSDITDGASSEGTSDGLARGDHVHAHGDLSAGTLHPQARRDMEDDASNTDGFLSAYYDLRYRRLSQMTVDYAATTVTETHMPTPTLLANALTSRTSARGDYVQLDTNSVSGNVAGIFTAAYFQRRMEPSFATRIRTGNLSNARLWTGMFSASPAGSVPGSLGAAGISGIGFAYDNATTITGNYLAVTANGTSTTTTDTGVAAGSSQDLALEIECEDLVTDEVRFYINGALVATDAGSTLPGTSTALLWSATITNLSAASRNFRAGIVTLTKAG